MLNLDNTLQPKVSPTIALGQKVKELKAAGEQVFNMSIGENRFPAPIELIDALKKYAAQVTYSDPQGINELRKAVSGFYSKQNRNVNPANILISPGSKAGIFILLKALEGDLMLIRPSWVSYEPQARHWGKKVYWIDTKFENSYIPTGDELRKAHSDAVKQGMKPKIIILNYPNNPTGFIPSRAKLKALVLVCKELGLTVVSDELYLQLCYEKKEAISPAEFYPEGTIVVGGISKFLSVAGWRIGWVVTPQTDEGEKLAAILKALASDVWSNVSTAIQYAVAEYLENADYTKYITLNTKLHELRNKKIYSELKKAGLKAIEPNAGFYIYLNLENLREKLKKSGVKNGIDLQQYMLAKYKIACLSGVNFGEKPDSLTLRLSSSFLDCNDSYQAEKLWREYMKINKIEYTLNAKSDQEINILLSQFLD